MTGTTHDLFHGELVRLAAQFEGAAEIFARWSEDGGYLRALDTDFVRPLSAREYAKILNPERPDPNRVEFLLRTLEDDRLIGFIALHSIEWNNQAALLAIGIGEPDYRGKGYGADALRLGLRYAFGELNLYRLGLQVIASNTRAISTYEKAGFQHEGALRGAVLRDGVRHDVLIMGILRDEWFAQRATSR